MIDPTRNPGDYSLKGHKEVRTPDGYCFEGHLCRKGIKVASYFDGGYGGEMQIEWVVPQEEALLNAHLATLPPLPSSYGLDPLPIDASLFISGLADDIANLKRLRRLCRNQIAFRQPKDDPDTIRIVKRPWDPALKQAFLAKYPDAYIYNEHI